MNVRVTASDDLRVRALAAGQVEEANCLSYGSGRRASRKEVISKRGAIWTSYTLDPDALSAIYALKSVAKRYA